MIPIWGDLPAAIRLYVTDTVLYSAIVALVVEALCRIWRVSQPSFRFKFRLLVLFLPVVSWTLYYVVSPERNGDVFRTTRALLDLNGWLSFQVLGVNVVLYAFLALLLVSTVFPFVQEVLPAIGHPVPRSKMWPLEKRKYPTLETTLREVADSAGRPVPRVLVVDRPEPVICALGSIRPALVVSTRLLTVLDPAELRGVLAHEMAHLIRRESWWSWLLLIGRALMFYNPVALLTFRKIAQDNEQICDDMAASITGQPLPLASGLLKVFRNGATTAQDSENTAQSGQSLKIPAIHSLYNSSHRAIVQKRAERLVHPEISPSVPYVNFRLGVVSVMLVGLLFFVV